MAGDRSKREREYDRMMRALLLLHLLNCNRQGMTVAAIAAHCGVSTRTVYRDLDALEATFGAKLYKEENRFVLLPGTMLPPVLFTVPEAMTVFMAARLLLQQSSVHNQHIEATFTKLATVVAPPLRDELLNTLRWMKGRPAGGAAVGILDTISRCWNERRQVKIRYWPLNAHVREERIIEPYFIQPSALEHAVYIIAHCRLRNELRVFRLDRVLEAQALETTYSVPAGFDANEYLNSYWSVTATGSPRTVKLRFRPEVARVAAETVWHGSQTTELRMDGSAVVTMRVAVTRDLVSFVLGWSDMVEVLAPRALQSEVARAAHKVAGMYRQREAAGASEVESASSRVPCHGGLDDTDGADSAVSSAADEGVQMELFAQANADPTSSSPSRSG